MLKATHGLSENCLIHKFIHISAVLKNIAISSLIINVPKKKKKGMQVIGQFVIKYYFCIQQYKFMKIIINQQLIAP